MAPRKKTGGGSRKGVPNKATKDIKALAQKYAPAAMKELARLAAHAENEKTRVEAIGMLLERGYGKAPQVIAGDKENPVEVIFGFRDSVRAKLARLAQSRPD